eukprot:TRINITY_DN2421_c0_g1_i1.p1 TRINITY_DN2421_c0_g1~~TRINITY_DN2421_c0_g1_i1.p1  ORF type:complete len:626 (+),score=103.86 TRINITY_DN2421_c0_g1_i1:58-1878(+)
MTDASSAIDKSAPRSVDAVKVFTFIDRSKPAAQLSWDEINFTVKTKSGRKNVLFSVSGELSPGQLTCILGPSGSGKTSLLNLLAGRVRKGGKSDAGIGGWVKLNGQVIEPSNVQQIFAYVMQDDALLGTMTPREVLQFAARMKTVSNAEMSHSDLIDSLLDSLSLTKCADTMVGNELIKGISGGERKRTAVGAELITNPDITFLDEPTSGLDAGAAYDLILVLKQLAMLQRSVLLTIHQPSSEIFHQFDQAIFLVGGQVAYCGKPSDIRAHFSTIDKVCPQDYNPADFVMFLLQTKDSEQVSRITEAWANVDGQRPARQVSEVVDIPKVAPRKGFLPELVALSAREVKNVFRDKGTLGARFGSTIFLTIIYSLVFFRVGSRNSDESLVDRDSYDQQSHAGAVTMLGISAMFGSAQPLLLTFTTERSVIMREHASNFYGIAPYFLSKTAVEVPVVILQNVVQWLIAFWAMGFQGNFFLHIVATTLVGLAAGSTAILVGCLVKDAKQAMEAAPGLFVPQILFAGFFIKMELIPVFMRWIQYICCLKWGMNIILHNEFGDDDQATRILDSNDIVEENLWISYLILVCIMIFCRILAVIALSKKSKAFYN